MEDNKEDLVKALGRISFMLLIIHIAGITQMYFFIPAILSGKIIAIVIGVVFLFWLSFEASKYQYQKKLRMAEYEKKYGNKE